jgi:catalase
MASGRQVRRLGAHRGSFGEHHARAVHANGLILQGTYTPSAEASDLCRAQLFSQTPVPAVVRFSEFTGLPRIPGTVVNANPRIR